MRMACDNVVFLSLLTLTGIVLYCAINIKKAHISVATHFSIYAKIKKEGIKFDSSVVCNATSCNFQMEMIIKMCAQSRK